MAFRLVRNDITKMKVDIIVNTANTAPIVGAGCDTAIYNAAGYEQLINARREIGIIETGEVAITPAFNLDAKYIIHAVSPRFIDGNEGEEQLLRNCYRNSLNLAAEKGAKSIAFPLISTGSFGYPKEEGLRIALDEINAFLISHDMEVYVVVFDEKSTTIGNRVYPGLESYIDRHYVEEKKKEEYHFDGAVSYQAPMAARLSEPMPGASESATDKSRRNKPSVLSNILGRKSGMKEDRRYSDSLKADESFDFDEPMQPMEEALECTVAKENSVFIFDEEYERRLADRIKHSSDTFSEYLLYLISSRGMKNSDVYKAALVNKKTFSKIKNNPDYHPNKMTAMCLCVGARLNLDETKDLLTRAGFALSPCDKTDIIFSFFIENEVYDIFEIDIQLEEHGLPALVDEKDLDF